MATKRITAAALEKMPVGYLWDGEVRGFGARRTVPGGDVYFAFKGRRPGAPGKQVWLTIGRWGRGDWTLDDARREAARLRDLIRRGLDPAAEREARKAMMTVSELCDAYLAAAADGDPRLLKRDGSAKKPATIVNDRGRIEGHIKPLMGRLLVNAVTRADVETLMARIAKGATAGRKVLGPRAVSTITGGRGAASRTVGLLGSIFAYAVKLGQRPDNPVRGITRYADKRRERRLSEAEYLALGQALDRAEGEGLQPSALAAIRLLLLTGWRRNEATTLRWSDIDLARRTATLGDTKTGRSVRPLARLAAELLDRQPRHFQESESVHAAIPAIPAIPRAGDYVFPSRTGGAVTSLPHVWLRVRAMAGLPADVTPHVLRHSFASLASDLGYGQVAISALLGHRLAGSTGRYTHAADAVVLGAADAVARAVAALLSGKDPAGDVVEMPRRA